MKGTSLKAVFSLQMVLLIVVLAVLLVTSVRGIDLGYHWDEQLHVGQAATSFSTGLFLPRFYGYPSLTYDLALLGAASSMLDKRFPGLARVKPLIRLRFIAIVVSAATVVFTYLITLQLFDDKNAALASAALLAFSWEFAYHIRWVASDSILLPFFFASYLFMILYLKKGAYGHLRASAVFGGLAVGGKYPVVFIIIPILSACALRTYFIDGKGRGFLPLSKELLEGMFKIAAWFIAAFLVTSPGVLLEPGKARDNILYIVRVYKSGGPMGYLTRDPMDHRVKLAAYLACAVFSHDRYVSLVLFATGLIGLMVLIRNNKLTAAVFLIFPIIYFCYFTRVRLMVARSYLVLIPFLCVLSAAGMARLVRFLKGKSAYLGLAAGLAFFLMIAYNAVFLVGAAEGIRNPGGDVVGGAYVKRLSDYMNKRKNRKFKISKRVADDLVRATGALPDNVISDGYAGEYYYVVYASQMPGAFGANRHNYAETTFGPYEVNFNYYPDWAGNDRIVVIPKVGTVAETEGGAIFADCEGRQFEVLSGCWRTDGDVRGRGGVVYWTEGGNGASKSRWVIAVPASDDYEVFARWTDDVNRASNAPYEIRHADGVDTVRVNQKKNGKVWNSLGVYHFSKETPAVITLANDADNYVIAGAVKLAPR